jgi:hypothetical protein
MAVTVNGQLDEAGTPEPGGSCPAAERHMAVSGEAGRPQPMLDWFAQYMS